MKIALCFFGKTYGHQTAYAYPPKQKKILCLHGFKSIRKNVMQDNDVDTYFHAWINTPLTTEDLCSLLKPKNFKGEKQKIFNKGVRQQGYLSHIYSRTQSLKMALDSEIKYDLIVAIRYDLIFFNPVKYDNVECDVLYADGDVYTRDWHIVGHPSVIKKLIPMFDFAKEKISKGLELTCTSKIYTPYYESLGIKRKTLLKYNPPTATEPRNTDFCLLRSLLPEELEYAKKDILVRTESV